VADGRVIIEGGEYNFGQFDLTNLGAIYDPVKNTWTPVTPPKGWTYIGDSPSVVLPNGNYLIGNKLTKADARTRSQDHEVDDGSFQRQKGL
jgi:hypothetical protein